MPGSRDASSANEQQKSQREHKENGVISLPGPLRVLCVLCGITNLRSYTDKYEH